MQVAVPVFAAAEESVGIPQPQTAVTELTPLPEEETLAEPDAPHEEAPEEQAAPQRPALSGPAMKAEGNTLVLTNTSGATQHNYSAGNYVQCDEGHLSNQCDSKLQWIQVPFVAESDSAVFTLERPAGSGQEFWDDIRIVKIKLDNFRADGSFKQDFESVVQGIYPFVLGSAQGVTDPRTHLAQRNDPYTQSGWHTKTLDEVIEGEWSLKHHENNKGIIYQTIPQNFRFEPGKVYEVSFDYQSGPNSAYAMVVGNSSDYKMPTEYFPGIAGHKAITIQ